MKSVMRIIVRVVMLNKRNGLFTLKPKGTEPDCNGCGYIMGNEQRVLGLQMASKVYIIICDIELGKAYALPVSGQKSREGDDGAEVRGDGKKRRVTCNELVRQEAEFWIA